MEMKISKSLEQACCVLVIVAENKGEPVSITLLNERMEVSLSYLRKITRKLVVADLIKATSGVNGGYTLSRDMSDINLNAVYVAIEGDEPFFQPSGVIERVFQGKLDLAEKGVNYIDKAFHKAEENWRNYLENITMKQVVGEIKKEQYDEK